MDAKIKDLGACRKEILFDVPKERVDKEFDLVYSDIQKHATLKGFRKGKAPMDLIKKQYTEMAKEEVIKSLISECYKEAVEKEKLAVASYPEIKDVNLNNGKFTFKALVDIRPDVKLKSYKGIKVASPKIEVKEEEVNKALESLKKSYAPTPKQEGADKDKSPAELPKLDDDFAKKLGLKDMDELKSKMNEQLMAQSKGRAEGQKRQRVIEHLLSGAKFEVPKSWIERQRAHVSNDVKIKLLMSGVKKEELDQKIKDEEAGIEKQSTDNVRLFFILDKIAEEEKIKVIKEEIDQYVKAMALRQGVSEEQLRKYLDEKNLWDDLIIEIQQGKVINFLLKETKND